MRSPQHNMQSDTSSAFNAEQIDQTFGLEPVFEPGGDQRLAPLTVWLDICCPHCWSSYASEFELGIGAENRIEDCPQCCGPIQLNFQAEAEPDQYRLGVERAY